MTSGMSRLIVLPDNPGTKTGYQKGVQADVDRLRPTDDDLVIVYSDDPQPAKPAWLLLPRPANRRLRRAVNMMRLRPTAEPLARELAPMLRGRQFDQIFCGETIFYHPLKVFYPDCPMTVRFHNIFAMARYRQSFRQFPIGRRLQFNIEAFFRVERSILNDPLVRPIFVTEEEQHYIKLAFPNLDSDCWPNSLQIRSGSASPMIAPSQRHLVYFGGVPSHTRPGVDYLVQTIFPQIRTRCPDLDLHMFGHFTEQYHCPDAGIIGHGFYKGDGFPMDGLFVVPDILGIGIKIKVGDLFHAGRAFAVTPFGTEGYTLPASDHILVADMELWPDRIPAYFQQQGIGEASPASAPAATVA